MIDKPSNTVIVRVINTSKEKQPVSINLSGIKGERTAETLTLTCADMMAENTLDEPEKITPQAGTLACTAGKKNTVINDEIAPMTFRLYKVKK